MSEKNPAMEDQHADTALEKQGSGLSSIDSDNSRRKSGSMDSMGIVSGRKSEEFRMFGDEVDTMFGQTEQQKKSKYRPTNEENWGFLRRITFSWVTPLVGYGYKHPLQPEDLCTLREKLNAEVLGSKLHTMWTAHVEKRRAEHQRQVAAGTAKSAHPRYSLASVLLRMFWQPITAMGIFTLAESAIRISQAVVLRKVINYVNGTENETWKGYVYAVLMGVIALGFAAMHHILFFTGVMIGMRARVACMTEVHRKLLRLSAAGMANTTSGQCVNLVSTDVRRFDEGPLFFHFVWAAPLELLVVALLVGSQLGWQPALAGTCCLVALMPLQGFFGRRFAKFRRKVVVFTDRRVKTIGEILQGMLGVKIFGWEPAFTASIAKIRDNERKYVEKSAMVRAFNEAFYFVGQLLVSLVTFATMIGIGKELTTAKVFFAVALFNLPRLWMGSFFPLGVEKISECYVTCQRLQRFLLLEEAHGALQTHSHGLAVGIRAGSLEVSRKGSSKRGIEPIPLDPNANSSLKPARATTGASTSDSALEEPPAGPSGAASAPSTSAIAAHPLSSANGIKDGAGSGKAVAGGVSFADGSGPREEAVAPSGANGHGYVGVPVQGPEGGLEGSDQNGVAAVPFRRVEVKDASFSWGSEEGGDKDCQLTGITCHIRDRQLLAVTGKVGCGKSSFLGALLGELHLKRGTMSVRGRLSYIPQQPFILAGTVRDNILFGSEFEESRYAQAVEVAALIPDLMEFPQGDFTEIGERGINLSGGQRARVALARAAYAQSDIVLLDDPLSAVDPAVARHLFSRCIKGFLSDRTVVLVTHQLQFLPECDFVFVMKQGAIEHKGTFEELKKVIDFSQILDADADDADGAKQGMRPVASSRNIDVLSEASGDNAMWPSPLRAKKIMRRISMKAKKGPSIVVDESKTVGGIKMRVVRAYTRYMGLPIFLFITTLMFIGQAGSILSDWFLSYWARSAPTRQRDLLWVYGLLVSVTTVISFGRAAAFFHAAIGASSGLHNAMLQRVLCAPLSFFHTNPSGRILNRFSADLGIVDDMLPITLFNFWQVSFICLGSLVIVTMGVPWVAILVLPLFLVFLWLRKKFVTSSRDTKRIEAITRSPVFSFFSSSLQGLTTIHAFGVQPQFHAAFIDKLNRNSRAFYSWSVIQRWLGFRCDSLVAITVLTASLVAVIARDHLTHSLVALALTYSLQLSGLLQWTVRQSAEVENLMTSVERMVEYTELPQEAALDVAETKPPRDWPQAGAISIQGLTVKYDTSDEPVLRGISLEIAAGTKCGIVGRTGAGKSSLMLALFRLMEPIGGRVVIDGVDTSKIGLHDLRRKIAAIPQDPILFGDSMRFNLDPFQEYTEEETWRALEAAQLKDKAQSLEGGLYCTMAEFGDNFSVGERQLLCMARAILHKCRILIMDEATANADFETDFLIQKMLKEVFVGTTVLVIAHRMDTIIDSDTVLVLDKGLVAEYGEPKILLENPNGVLASMVNKTSAASQSKLREKAHLSFMLRSGTFSVAHEEIQEEPSEEAALEHLAENGNEPGEAGDSSNSG
eukprot:jgi/Mesvir1/19562/Mv07034-RA.1